MDRISCGFRHTQRTRQTADQQRPVRYPMSIRSPQQSSCCPWSFRLSNYVSLYSRLACVLVQGISLSCEKVRSVNADVTGQDVGPTSCGRMVVFMPGTLGNSARTQKFPVCNLARACRL